MDKLKPCPFCGGQAEVMRYSIGSICVGCKACAIMFFEANGDEAEAAKKWNHRKEPSKIEIKTAISNIDKPSGMDDEQVFAVMANIYYALAKLYGEEIPEYMPSGGKEDEN